MRRFGKLIVVILTLILAMLCFVCGCSILHTTNTDNIKTTSHVDMHQAIDDFSDTTGDIFNQVGSSLKLPGSPLTSGTWCSSVPSIDQYELGMPAGCEIVSATALVNSLGYDTTAEEMLEYINVNDEGDFVNGYNGSVYAHGGTFPPAVANMVSTYLDEKGSIYAMSDTTGTDFDILLTRAKTGVPALVWTTMYMEEPDLTDVQCDGWTWYTNEHCVVLTGYNSADDAVLVMDPLSGDVVERDYNDFLDIFIGCGQMSASLIYK